MKYALILEIAAFTPTPSFHVQFPPQIKPSAKTTKRPVARNDTSWLFCFKLVWNRARAPGAGAGGANVKKVKS